MEYLKLYNCVQIICIKNSFNCLQMIAITYLKLYNYLKTKKTDFGIK